MNANEYENYQPQQNQTYLYFTPEMSRENIQNKFNNPLILYNI